MAAPAIWRRPSLPGRNNPFATLTGSTAVQKPRGLNFARSLFGGSTNQGKPGGGGNPYSDLISSFLNQTRADLAAEGVADAAGRDAALRKLFISYGDIPDFGNLGISESARGFLQGALDPKTRELAAKNTAEGLSVKARLDRENAVAQRRIPAALAARGMLRSGQTGSDFADQQLAYKQRGFDTLNELLGSAESTVSSFLNAERERQRALAQAEMDAAFRAMDVWGDSYLGDGGSGSPFASAVANSVVLAGGGRGRPGSRITPGNYSNVRRRPANRRQNPYAFRPAWGGGSR